MKRQTYRQQQIAAELDEPVEHATMLAKKLGLDPYPVNYWIVDYDEMNQLIAYEGFTERYPHWRWGMQYDRQRKIDQYQPGKAFEIVNNDNPANAFLQESNTMADQKAVITHVLAHADFFKQNEWFATIGPDDPGPAAMLAQHAERIQGFMQDPDIDREAVEIWIDHILSIMDTIDQRRPFVYGETVPSMDGHVTGEEDPEYSLGSLAISEEVREAIFDEEWLSTQAAARQSEEPPYGDLMAYLRAHGMQHDDEAGRAKALTTWQGEVIEMLRAEAYYFAPQRMTKVANEGWSAFWESIMMTGEGIADEDEIIAYADHMARVLGGGGLNPYELGKRVWEYVENTANRREVMACLLRVEGITPSSLSNVVDFSDVLEILSPPQSLVDVRPETLHTLEDIDDRFLDADAVERAKQGKIDVTTHPWQIFSYEGLAWRNYSLLRPQNRGFLARITDSELEEINRYILESDQYATVEEALADVDISAGWDRMREVRQSHNDVTFLDEFLTEEFIREQAYFAYEFSFARGEFRVSSRDAADIKQKLLLLFTNFGKPRVVVADGNYKNRNELLLAHQYNGIMLDIEEASEVLKRIFQLWGRPVNLKTIVKTLGEETIDEVNRRATEPDPNEQGMILRYDGDEFEARPIPWSEVEDIAATDLDYNTKPDNWFG